jgi:hypothetical protein
VARVIEDEGLTDRALGLLVMLAFGFLAGFIAGRAPL